MTTPTPTPRRNWRQFINWRTGIVLALVLVLLGVAGNGLRIFPGQTQTNVIPYGSDGTAVPTVAPVTPAPTAQPSPTGTAGVGVVEEQAALTATSIPTVDPTQEFLELELTRVVNELAAIEAQVGGTVTVKIGWLCVLTLPQGVEFAPVYPQLPPAVGFSWENDVAENGYYSEEKDLPNGRFDLWDEDLKDDNDYIIVEAPEEIGYLQIFVNGTVADSGEKFEFGGFVPAELLSCSPPPAPLS